MPETNPETGGADRAAHLPATIALAASGILLGFLVLLAPIHAAIPPVQVPEPLVPHHQPAENLLYGLAFFVLLPLGAWLSVRLADRLLAGGNPDLIGPLAGCSVLVAASLLVVTRLLDPGSHLLWIQAGLALIAILILGPMLWRACGDEWPAARFLEDHTFTVACLSGVATVLAVASLGYPSRVDWPWLLAGLTVAGGVAWSFGRVRLPRPSRRWGRPLDAAILVLVVLAVPDLIIFQGVGETWEPGNPFLTYVTGFHQSLYLGAASQILNGAALLVDTVSQYGVVSIYLLAAFFKVAPIGNGTLGFFDASLTALTFGAGYAILRMAGVGRLFATATMAVAVVVLVWALEYPIGALLQHGGLRFGLPVPLILFWVAAARFRSLGWLRIAGWVLVGLSSVWALEAFIYVTGAMAAMVLLQASLMPADRVRWIARQVSYALIAWVSVQVVFALATLIWAGSLPDWGLYITYLRDFLAGDVGDLTYDVPSWSPGLTVGFTYLVSALGLIVTVTRCPDWLRSRPVAALALAGLTGYGIVLYSYFDNRSLAHVIPYISLPLVLSVAIWLWLVITGPEVPRRVARVVLAAVLGVTALSVATVMPAAAERGKTSLLVSAFPGGNPLRESFHRLWNPPELVAGADQGAQLLEEYMPDQDASPVLTTPDLDNNILSRAGRANSLAITDAKEQSWVEGPHIQPVKDAAAGLGAGDLVLVDRAALQAFADLRRDPDADRARITKETGMADIQLIALREIANRYEVKVVARQGDVFVVRLTPDREIRVEDGAGGGSGNKNSGG
ncbi:MAG: hypothetical protein H6532_00795 [Thermoleophilales bacterium]|nr:hypothetical protein [Thermoleophilales bacterium]